jgi:hypothetical protein
MDAEKDIISGNGVLLTISTATLAQYNTNVKRYGWNPLRLGKQDIVSFNTGFVIPKYMPWKEEMDKILGRIRDAGIVEKFVKALTDMRAVIDNAEQHGGQELVRVFRNFTILDEATIFMALAVGIAVSVVAFLGEVFSARGRARRLAETRGI